MGITTVYIGVPSIVTRQGIRETIEIDLNKGNKNDCLPVSEYVKRNNGNY